MKNNDFISSWTIPEYICDEILDYFHKNKHLHRKGLVYTDDRKSGVDTDYKVSTDLSISPAEEDRPFGEYRSELQKCLDYYVEEYSHVNKIHRFNVTEVYNIQHYKIGEGFKGEHCERDGSFDKTIKRCLVFMTYLNDLEDGGTIFKYQNRIIKAQKGKTIIWPADWTHTHCGQISKTQDKTIVTGWFSYLW